MGSNIQPLTLYRFVKPGTFKTGNYVNAASCLAPQILYKHCRSGHTHISESNQPISDDSPLWNINSFRIESHSGHNRGYLGKSSSLAFRIHILAELIFEADFLSWEKKPFYIYTFSLVDGAILKGMGFSPETELAEIALEKIQDLVPKDKHIAMPWFINFRKMYRNSYGKVELKYRRIELIDEMGYWCLFPAGKERLAPQRLEIFPRLSLESGQIPFTLEEEKS